MTYLLPLKPLFMKPLLILTVCTLLFISCKNSADAPANATSANVHAPAEELLLGYWFSAGTAGRSENTVYEISNAGGDVVYYNPGIKMCKILKESGSNNILLSAKQHNTNDETYAVISVNDSAMQLQTSEGHELDFRKIVITKKETFEFNGMLDGLGFQDQEILLNNKAYVIIHSAINDSIVQFNFFSRSGKNYTQGGALTFCTEVSAGTYFIRAFVNRRKIASIEGNVAFKIPFTLLHTE